MGEGSQASKSAMKPHKSSTELLTYDQLAARVQLLEEGLRLALANSMMPRQLIANLMALLPEGDRAATNLAAQEYRED